MKLGNVTTIFRKELVETLRDRRTLIFMLLVPVLAIPGIMLGMSKLMISQIGKLEQETTTYVVQGWEYLPTELQQKLAESEKLVRKTEEDFKNQNVIDKVKDGSLDAVLAVREDFQEALSAEDVTKAEIYSGDLP
jgi:sodium transport system permease protein